MAAAQGTYGANQQIMNAAQAAAVLQQGGDINSIMAGWVDRGAWTYYDRILQPIATNGGVLYQTYSPFSVGINKPDTITAASTKPSGSRTCPTRGNSTRRGAWWSSGLGSTSSQPCSWPTCCSLQGTPTLSSASTTRSSSKV